jgi:glycine cleavage system transcriptional repressor
MSDYIIISALGDDRPGLISELTGKIAKCGCSIEDTRMTVMAGQFAILIDARGNKDRLEKLNSCLPEFGKKLNLEMIWRHRQSKKMPQRVIPCTVKILSIDDIGLVHNVTQFFAKKKINIENLETSTYLAPQTASTLFSAKMIVSSPIDLPINDLRDELIEFCDSLNIDASIIPSKESEEKPQLRDLS